MEPTPNNKEPVLWSSRDHQLMVGWLGATMPLVVWLVAAALWFTELQSSVSKYYYTGTGAYFVGVLFAISLLLMSYKGYKNDDKLPISDNIAGNLAGAFGLATALIPTAPAYHASHAAKTAAWFHYGAALLFFVMLIYFCLYLFPKSNILKKDWGKMKRWRNNIYTTCGIIMIGAIVLLVIYFFLPDGYLAWLKPYQPIYWLEAITVGAFGVSWLIKGGAFLKDPPKTAESS